MARGISGRALARRHTGQVDGSPVFVLHLRSSVSAGATSTEYIFQQDAPFDFRILTGWVILKENSANASETIILRRALKSEGWANARDLGDALSIAAAGSDNDRDFKEFGEMDDAYYSIKRGDSLYVYKTGTAVIACDVYLLCVRE